MQWDQIHDLLLVSATILFILIPVVGLTVRFSLGPLIDKFARLRANRSEELADELAELRQQVVRLGQRVSDLGSHLHQLEEIDDFERKLRAPSGEPDLD